MKAGITITIAAALLSTTLAVAAPKRNLELERIESQLGQFLADRDRAALVPNEIARVQDLVRKRGLGRDPEVQALEDALCLAFLETQLAELAGRMQPAHLVAVLRKSLRKMSRAAQALAGELPLRPAERELLERALREEREGAPLA